VANIAKAEADDQKEDVPQPVGATTVRGAAWTFLFSILSKGLSFGGQIVIAWFLLPSEMGLAAMALAISALTSVVGSGHLRTLLVQRQESFRENAGQVYWLSITIGVFMSLVYVAGAPLLSDIYGEPRVSGLIYVLAAVPPLESMKVVYGASLKLNLRFRTVASIHFLEAFIVNGGMIAFAMLGFGAYALVVPHVISAAVSLWVQRKAVGSVPYSSPNPLMWWSFLLPALWLGMEALSGTLLRHGSNFIIGVIHDSEVTGLYFWGYALSAQAVFLLARNLQGVLFPSFTKLKDSPERQKQAYVQVSQGLLATVAPVCVLQILLVGPLVHVLFPERWLPAVPVVQWLSVGMATQPLSVLMLAVLKAKGKFEKLAFLSFLNAAIVLSGTLFGAYFGEEATIARWTGLALFVSGLVQGGATMVEYTLDRMRFIRSVLAPIFSAALAGYAGWVMGATGFSVVTVTLTVLITYSLLMGLIARDVVESMYSRLKIYLT
jgi:PST family polysaccharide transporter